MNRPIVLVDPAHSVGWSGYTDVNEWDGSSTNETLTLDEALTVNSNDIRGRSTERDRGFGDGSRLVGKAWDARVLTVEGLIKGATEADLRDSARQIMEFSQRDFLKLYFDEDYYINLSAIDRIAWKWQDYTGKEVADVSLTWKCGDPYWYSTDVTNQTLTISGTGSAAHWGVTFDSTSLPAYPLITFALGEDWGLADDPIQVRILSGTSPYPLIGKVFEIRPVYNYTSGDVIYIDCHAGTVKSLVSGVEYNTIHGFYGEFPSIQSNRRIEVTSPADATGNIIHRSRWL